MSKEFLHINPDYQSLLPELSREEYEALKESIRKDGLHYPIEINRENVILDGHNRYKICKELGVSLKTEVRNFKNKLLEKAFVITVNLRRRHLNDFQKCEMSMPLLEIEQELAKKRKAQAKGKPRGTKALTSSIELERGQARDIVAKKIGVSHATFQRATKIINEAPEDLKEKVRKGMSIHYAYKSIRRQEKHEAPPELPMGEFDVLYADPPWKYYLRLGGSPDSHYNMMDTEDICTLKIPSAQDAILFLWCTNTHIEDALKVIQSWGFHYRTNLVWVKNRIGTGSFVRGKHELLLIATKGDVPTPMEKNRPHSVLQAPTRKHSQKPDEFYSIIEKMYPNRKYLELFARRKRKNWESWGNEIQN